MNDKHGATKCFLCGKPLANAAETNIVNRNHVPKDAGDLAELAGQAVCGDHVRELSDAGFRVFNLQVSRDRRQAEARTSLGDMLKAKGQTLSLDSEAA